MRSIYLDHNATTPLHPAAREAMLPYLDGEFGNPASAHAVGRRARQAVEIARERLAGCLDAYPDEVVFTSGATEANNLALFGLAGAPPGHVIASPIEHPSVAEPVARLAQTGFTATYLPVHSTGVVGIPEGAETIREGVRLVTVMQANHETGAFQPVAAIRRYFPTAHFHCDAVQAAGKIPVQFHELGVTTLSLSAHKSHGPQGIGVLLVRRGTRLGPLSWGGHQQNGRRPGTEPVALVVGMARALEIACQDQQARLSHLMQLRAVFLDRLSASGISFTVNGPARVPEEALPHTLNLSFPGCRSDALLMNLDLAGVACSTGSACSSGSLLPSPVLKAMGVAPELLRSAMRFSLSNLLTASEVAEGARRVGEVVRRLRRTDE